MKFCTILIFVIFYTTTAQAKSQTEVENNAVFIEDIKKWVRTTYVIILYDDSSDNTKENIFFFKLSRLLFMKGIQVLTIKFTNLDLLCLSYGKKANRPLIIVYLSKIESLKKFEWSSKEINMKWAIWVIIFMERYGNPLLNYCKNPPGNLFNLSFDSKVIIKCYEDTILREWYSIYENQTEVCDLASWDPKNHLSNQSKKSLYDKRFSIGGKTLRTVTIKQLNVTRVKNKLGLFTEVLDLLGKVMNFTINIVSEEDQYGTLENGKWSGIMSKLCSGEVDLAATEMSMTEKRLSSVDFTLPLLDSYKAVYFRQPNGTEIRGFGYFQAFHQKVWGILLLLLIIIPTCLTYIMYKMGKCHDLYHIFIDNFLEVWRIYCQQGITDFPKRSSLRVVYFLTFMSSLVLLSAYSASLVSHLAVSSPNLPFSTINEFINQSSYKMIVIHRGETFDSITNSNDWFFTKMRSFLKKEKDLPFTFREGFHMVCKDKRTVFMVDQTAEGTITHFAPCTLAKILTQNKISLAMSLPKNSPYTGVFNYHLQRFKEFGLLTRIVRQNFREKLDFRSRDPDSIALRGVKPILGIIIGGLVLAIFILILEKIHFYYQEKKNKQKNQAIVFFTRRRKRIFPLKANSNPASNYIPKRPKPIIHTFKSNYYCNLSIRN